MKLYEIDIGSLWWVSAIDEFAAIDFIRGEFHNIEFSEEEVDAAMDNLIVREVERDEACSIPIVDEYGTAISTLWSMFLSSVGPGLITSDFEQYEEDFDHECY